MLSLVILLHMTKEYNAVQTILTSMVSSIESKISH